MANPMKANGNNGTVIQVFRPNRRIAATDTIAVNGQEVIRMSADGAYEMDADGVKVPFAAGYTIGVPLNVTEIKLYDTSGATLTAQTVEIM